MPDNVIIVFTAKSKDRILSEGGTSSWVLDRNNARACEFVICTRNAHADWVEGDEPHGSAFLIGRVKDVVPSPDHAERWLVLFSEYADLNEPEVWQGWRNPVRYTRIPETGIAVPSLTFKPMPARKEMAPTEGRPGPLALTIQQAKNGLARGLGISPSAIEIVIRS